MRAVLLPLCLHAFTASAAADSLTLPGPLLCYKRYYGLDSEWRDGHPYLKLPLPTSLSDALLYDDGKNKDLETRLAEPDVEDQFAQPYRTGPIVREATVDRDPGRVRVTAILRAIYGATPAAVEAQLTFVAWFGARLHIHRRVAPALLRVRARIEKLIVAEKTLEPWLTRPAGGYVHRPIAGTDRLSPHSFGIAIDIDPKRTEYWRWDRNFEKTAPKGGPFARPVPAILVAAFEAEGFIWGGRWYHYDTMHFEFRPEIVDPQCAP